MEKFSKKDRSTWPYFWAHWFAFQMTAVMLHRWKFKYLFHDWYKPWLKMFGWKYKRIQTFHRNHSNHHIEYLLNTIYEKEGGITMANIEAIIVDGVRYDKVKAKTEFVCDDCELREICENVPYVKFAVQCSVILSKNECWKRNK